MSRFTTAPTLTAPALTIAGAAWTAYRRHVTETLADIVADANRMTPEQVAEIIMDNDLHGAPGDTADTAAGNYVVHQALAANLAPALYAIVMGDRLTLANTRTRAILAEVDITGTLYDLECLIADDNDPEGNPAEYFGFGELVIDPDDPETMTLSPADLEPDTVTVDAPLFGDFTTDDDPEYFDALTTWRDAIAA